MTEVTRIAAAAYAVHESVERVENVVPEIGLLVRISTDDDADVRTVERIVADVEKRYGILIKLEFER